MANKNYAMIAVSKPTKDILDQRKRELESAFKGSVTWDGFLLDATLRQIESIKKPSAKASAFYALGKKPKAIARGRSTNKE